MRQAILELIQTIFVYKFPELTRGEIENMLGLSELKQTKVYQEAREEGVQEEKLKMVHRLLNRGLGLEETAGLVELPIETIRGIAEQQSFN